MIYIFSYFAGRKPWVMRFFLAARWLLHYVVGHPLTLNALVAAHFGWWHLTILILVADLAATKFYSPLNVWVAAWKFRRRWPVLWAQTQKNQLLDHDDGHLNRPWLAAPKLSLVFARYNNVVSWSLRPAVGKTFEDLEHQLVGISAGSSSVSELQLDYNKAIDHRGRLSAVFGQPYISNQPTNKRNRYATNA